MADFIPANIIQTPDFGQLAKERVDRKRQEETSKNAFIDKFEQAQGMYLEGDAPAVQCAWDNVQKTIDLVAENDSPEMRRKLKDAYGEYSKIAGTAQVLADQHREQVGMYKSKPSSFAMSGSDFFKWDEEFRLTKRSYNDMVSSLDNPNVLPSADSYALLNPYDQAKTLMADTSSVAASFYDNNGVLDEEGLKTRAEDIARKRISASPEAIERAIIWGATSANNPKSGFAGDGDGKINSLAELEMIKNLPEEEREKYFDAYINALVGDYMGLTPGVASKDTSGKKKLATDPVSLQAAGGKTVDFITLPGDVNGITQIGAAPNGEIFITVEERSKTGEIDDQGNEIYETKVEYRPATQTEVSKIQSKYGNTYDLSSLNVRRGSSATTEAEQPTAEQPATEEQPTKGEKTKDTLGLGLFDEPVATETTEVATGSTEVAPAFTYDQWSEDNKEQIDIVSTKIDDVNAQLDNPETSSEAPNMFDEASRAYEDIKNTRKEIDKAKNEGQDTTELEKILEVQVNTVKRINETNKKWSEKTKETSRENAAVEQAEQPAVETEEKQEREYIVIDGKPYFKDDYNKIAGTRTGKGNYPDTFEEYAESMGAAIANTKDKPLSNELDEVTVTAERISPPVSKEDVSPVQAGGVAPVKRSKEEAPVIDIIGASPALSGSGKPESKHTYKSREGAIAPAKQWSEESGVPAPSKNPSSTSAPSYYLKGEIEGMDWTPETVKKAMDRWNNDVPVDPEVFIKAANTFGIPVEFIIALAAKEGGIGVGDRQVRTKNFFNWGNSTKGDNLPPGPEQDKYNKYFETWEDGVMAWADGLVRMYRPDDGDWSKLWEDDKGFVTQRSGAGFEKGTRYATSTDQEAKIKEIIDYSYALQFDPETALSTTK